MLFLKSFIVGLGFTLGVEVILCLYHIVKGVIKERKK